MLNIAELQARRDLEAQLTRGNEIAARFASAIATSAADGTVEEVVAAARNWYQHTNGLLERQFTTLQISESFVMAAGMRVRSTYEQTRTIILTDARDAHQARLDYLRGLLDRLHIYVPGDSALGHGPTDDRGERLPQPAVSINITSVGQFNVAELVKNINSGITGLAQTASTTTLADALQGLTRAISEDPDLSDDDRVPLLQSLDDLVEQGNTAPAERKPGRIKAALAFLAQAAKTAVVVKQALDEYAPGIEQHLLH